MRTLALLPEVKNEPAKVETSARDFDADAAKTRKESLELVTMSNRYRKLTGDELDLTEEYTDFTKNRRPSEGMRTYLDRKYDLSAKESAVAEKKKSDYEEKLRKEGEERFQKANPRSANDGISTPRASKFDKFQKLLRRCEEQLADSGGP